MCNTGGLEKRGGHGMMQPCPNTLDKPPRRSVICAAWYGWLGAALVLIGYYFNAHELSICWPIWIVGNLLVGVYSFCKGAYPTVAMSFALVIMNIYGFIKWL